MDNRQLGPPDSADALIDVVARVSYKPDWSFRVADIERPTEQCAGSRGLTLCIAAEVVNSYHPKHMTRVEHWLPVPPIAYDRPTWERWVLDMILLVEQHEALEFFRVDGELIYGPAHGPLQNPYTIKRR